MTKKERYAAVIAYFEQAMPLAETELHFDSDFQLLVAVMLSAQCTDKRVNLVTPALFQAFPTPTAMAAATEEQVLEYIKSVSYPNSKARHLLETARQLQERFGCGRVAITLRPGRADIPAGSGAQDGQRGDERCLWQSPNGC